MQTICKISNIQVTKTENVEFNRVKVTIGNIYGLYKNKSIEASDLMTSFDPVFSSHLTSYRDLLLLLMNPVCALTLKLHSKTDN